MADGDAERSQSLARNRVYIDLVYGVSLLFLQHGAHSVIVLGLLLLSYTVGRITAGTRYRVAVAWTMGLLTILLKESYRLKRSYPVGEISTFTTAANSL